MRVTEQLSLPFGRALLPFAVSPLTVRRRALRRFRALRTPRIELRRVAEDQALAEEIRRGMRRRARGPARNSRVRTVAYLATAEGQRALRVIAALSERMAQEESRLCG